MALRLHTKHHMAVKYSMYAVTVIVFLLGVALMGFGIWMRGDFNYYVYFSTMDPILQLCHTPTFDMRIRVHIVAISYFLLFLGIGIIAIGMVGCCGAVKERQVLLFVFGMCMASIFSIAIAAIFQAATNLKGFSSCKTRVERNLVENVKLYYTDHKRALVVDAVQTTMACCSAEFRMPDFFRGINITRPPDSCIAGKSGTSIIYYTETCFLAVNTFFEGISGNLVTVMAVTVVLGVFVGLTVGVSMYLMFVIMKEKN